MPNSIKYSKIRPNKVIMTSETLTYTIGPVSEIIYGDEQIIDPVLENNTWSTIKAVCQAGDAANYWAVGDEKIVTAGGYSRPVKIVHMGEIYEDKQVVFQFWNRTENNYKWDEDNYNAVETADIWSDIAPDGGAYAELVSGELGNQLVDTTVKVATSGEDDTLIEITGKLFLPAEKELTKTRAYSVEAEFDALTTFDYYSTNDTNAARVKHKASEPNGTSGIAWWERSPCENEERKVGLIGSTGLVTYNFAYDPNRGVAPCFAF